MIIEFAGIMFNSNVPDDNGCLWFITEFEGWGSPGTRTTTVEPTSKDGVLVAQGLSDGRALGFKVLMKTTGGEDAFWAAWNYLEENTNNLYDPKDFIVTEGSTRRKVGVVRAQETRARIIGVLTMEADVSLLAPDPKKYVVP